MEFRIAKSKLQNPDCEIQIANSQIANSKMKFPSCKFQIAKSRLIHPNGTKRNFTSYDDACDKMYA